MNVLEHAIAVFGRWSKKVKSLSTLLYVEELPGSGWKVVSERAWRVGEFAGPPVQTKDEYRLSLETESEESHRARMSREFVAYRVLKTKRSVHAVMTQLLPYVTEGDAASSVPKVLKRLRGRSNKQVVVESDMEVDESLSALSNTVFVEQRLKVHGEDRLLKLVLGNVGRFLLVLECTDRGEGWSWEDVIAVATLQILKIQRTLELETR